MSRRPSVLVLFDIDGTLIRTGGAGVRGMSEAFERVHGRTDAMRGVAVAGRTDAAILAEVFGRWGEDVTEAAVGPLLPVYLEALERQLYLGGGPGFGVLPGVHQALDALDAHPGFTPGLLTGNVEEGARVKLAHFDLWRRFRFGAFGDHHADRRTLVPVAVERARIDGIEPTHVVVIGDTPLDVDCAHAHGATAVAVATGDYSRDQLRAAGADVVVDTLEALHPFPAALQALGAAPR